MVPAPPISLQLRGATVLVISLMSVSSIVRPALLLLTPTLLSPLPPPAVAKDVLGEPVGVPPDRESGPVTGVGGASDGGGGGAMLPGTGEIGSLPTAP